MRKPARSCGEAGEEEGSAEEKARQRTSLRGFSKETPTPHKPGAAVRRPEDPQSFLMPPWESSPLSTP